MTSNITNLMGFLGQKGIWGADANKNGGVTKEELASYLKTNGQECTTSELDELWNLCNKNVTGMSGNVFESTNLTEADVKEFMKKAKAIDLVKSFVTSQSAPTGIDQNAWVNAMIQILLDDDITNSIAATIQIEDGKSCSIKDVSAAKELINTLYSSYSLKVAANLYAEKFINDSFEGIEGYNVKNDKDLMSLINSYVSKMSDTTFEAVYSSIQTIIEAYKSTAIVGENGLDYSALKDIPTGGYNPTNDSPLNALQIAKIKSNVKKALTADAELKAQFSGDWGKLYNKLLDNFIASLTEGKTFADFEDLMNPEVQVEAFKSNPEYTKVVNQEAVGKLLGLVPNENGEITFGAKIDETVMKAIKDALGDIVAKAFKDAQNTSFVKDIINNILDATANDPSLLNADGSIDKAALLKQFNSLVAANIGYFLMENDPATLSKIELSTLDKMYDSIVEAADKESTESKRLEGYQRASLIYCTAIAGKGGTLKNFVTHIFGEDFKTTIQEIDNIEELTAKMDDLKAKVTEFGDVTTFEANSSTWSAFGDIKTGESKENLINYVVTFVRQVLQQVDKNAAAKQNMRNFISEQFKGWNGNNLADVASNMTYDNIESAVKAISDKYQTYVASSKDFADIKWQDVTAEDSSVSLQLQFGEKISKTLNPAVISGDRNIDLALHRVEFVSSDTSLATISNNDKGEPVLTVTGPNTRGGISSVTVTMFVDGVDVGRMSIEIRTNSTVNTNEIANIGGNMASPGDGAYFWDMDGSAYGMDDDDLYGMGVISLKGNDKGTNYDGDMSPLEDFSFQDLYNNGYNISLLTDMDNSHRQEDYGTLVKEQLNRLAKNSIKPALMQLKLDEAKLDQAIDAVVAQFTSGNWEDYVYWNDSGTNEDDSRDNLQQALNREFVNQRKSHIIGTRDDDGADSDSWGVNFKDFVDAIMAKYNELVS